MYRIGCLSLLLTLFVVLCLLTLFPATTGNALEQLEIPGDLALLFFLGMLVGSAINVPLWRYPTRKLLRTDPLAIIGLPGVLPNLETQARRVVVAVNVGGGLIPLGVVSYVLFRLLSWAMTAQPTPDPDGGPPPNVHGILIALLLSTFINVLVCRKVARPVPGIGIALPGILPGVVAAACALLLAAETAPSVALISGVLGPIIGADLLRLRDLRKTPVGLQSIGGAGTFDAVLFSCVVAVCLGG